jgi:hypothetical protein
MAQVSQKKTVFFTCFYYFKAGSLLGPGKLDQLHRDLLTIELVRRFGGKTSSFFYFSFYVDSFLDRPEPIP